MCTAFIALITACSSPIVDMYGSISGVAIDEKTNEPLSGVTVSLSPSGYSQVTDREGTFQFENLEPAEYTLTFTRAGYDGANRKATVKAGATASVHVSMSPLKSTLSIEPSILDFGKTQTSLKISLKKTGGQSVSYEVSSSNKWLTLSKSSGVVSNVDYITAVVSRNELASGKYEATVRFDVEGSQFVIPVMMEVAVNEKPVVTAERFSDVTTSSVRLEGTLASTGSDAVTAYGFCWSKNENPTVSDEHTTLGDAKEIKAFECVATGLESNTRYYFRAYAVNGVGVAYSVNSLAVTTKAVPQLPMVIAERFTDLTFSSVTLEGTLASIGTNKVTDYGFCWSEDEAPTISDAHKSLGSATETKAFGCSVTELKSNTRYYFRAYAANAAGIAYSEKSLTITTKAAPGLPVVTMTGNYDLNSYKFYASLTSTGNTTVSAYGHVWSSTNSKPSIDKDSFSVHNGPVNEPTDYSSTLTDLKSNTTYYICAYATNDVGTAYSSAVYSFKTDKDDSQNPPVPPTPQEPTNGLYARYKFDGDAKNSYGEAPSGQAIGTSYVEGVSGSKALRFAGSANSYLNIPDAMIDILDFSVSFWVQDLVTDGMVFHVVQSATQYGVSNAMIMRDGKLSYMQDGYNLLYKDGKLYELTPPFTHETLSGWHMITLTSTQPYKGADVTAKLYIDGEFVDLVSLQVQDNRTIDGGTKFVFGGAFSNNLPKQYFSPIPMTIDNLRVYTRVLSATEIQNLYDYEK